MRTKLSDHWRPRIVAMCILLLVCTVGSNAYGQVTRGSRTPTPVTLKAPGPPPTSLTLSQNCGPECVGLAWVAPEGTTLITVERHLSAHDQNPVIVRRFEGFDSRGPLGWSDANALAGLPPRFPVRYRVVAHYPDKGPGAAEVIVSAHGSAHYDFKSQLADAGKTVVFTWTSLAGPYARPKHYQVAGSGGAPSSPAVPFGSDDNGGGQYEYRWNSASPGKHRFTIVTTYGVPGFGDWDLIFEALDPKLPPSRFPFTTVTVPHCVLIYKRAPHALALTGPFPAETLAMSLTSDPTHGLELGIVGFRNSRTSHDFKRNGDHLREVSNVGYRPVRLNLSNAVLGTTPIEMINPGQTKSFLLDLGGAICAP